MGTVLSCSQTFLSLWQTAISFRFGVLESLRAQFSAKVCVCVVFFNNFFFTQMSRDNEHTNGFMLCTCANGLTHISEKNTDTRNEFSDPLEGKSARVTLRFCESERAHVCTLWTRTHGKQTAIVCVCYGFTSTRACVWYRKSCCE